jgi:serine/threonine-protein kinase RsbT
MGSFDQTRAATAATELARNMMRHAGEGRATIEVLTDPEGVRVVFEDRGPGIADVAQALQDGYSSSGGLGQGLGGAKRLVDELELETAAGEGTTITMTKWLRR